MTLYEIDSAILGLIDEETGEIADIEAFEQLQMDRETKLENLALWCKDLKAEATMIKAEEDNLKARRQHVENKLESVKKYLTMALNGEKFKTAKVNVSYRASKSVELDEDWFQKLPAECIELEPKAKKTDIKTLLQSGLEVPGAHLVESNSIQIK